MPPPLAAQPLAVVSRNAHARPLCLTTNMKLKNNVNQRLILLNAIAVLGLAPPRRHAANFRGGYLVTREPREHQIGAQNMVEQHAAQVLENIGRRQGPAPPVGGIEEGPVREVWHQLLTGCFLRQASGIQGLAIAAVASGARSLISRGPSKYSMS